MATLTQMASTSSIDVPDASRALYRGKAPEQDPQPKGKTSTQRIRDTKYRHVFATHSVSRTSCLSQDAEESPSFVGFRNLMVLVLSALPPQLIYVCLLTCDSRFQLAIDDCQFQKGSDHQYEFIKETNDYSMAF